MAIRGLDANLVVGKAAEQSQQASQAAKYHETLLDRLAQRAHTQEARDAERTQAKPQAEKRGLNDLNADGGGLGGGGSDGAQEREPRDDDSFSSTRT